jgi:hypothetical protein
MPFNTRRPSLLLLVCGLLAIGWLEAGCSVSMKAGYFEDDGKAAIQAIDEFHTRYNAGQSELIYREAHDVFRTALSQADMAAAMTNTRRDYGDMVSVTSRLVHAVAPPPINVNAVYNTKFAQRGCHGILCMGC